MKRLSKILALGAAMMAALGLGRPLAPSANNTTFTPRAFPTEIVDMLRPAVRP